MCYTCTYSLCKGCTRDADFSCVRGNKGFCSTCMKMIMLIEKKDQANNEPVQVDFDDKSSWEYLFKVYWVLLKEKQLLTENELLQARNPRKVFEVPIKPDLSTVPHTTVSRNVSVSYRSTDQLELNGPHVDTIVQHNDSLMTELLSTDNKAQKLNGVQGEDGPQNDENTVKPKTDMKNNKDEPSIKEVTDKANTKEDQDQPSMGKDTDEPCICKTTNSNQFDKPGLAGCAKWASEELLEFVAQMRNGDASAMSKFDVQMLLFDYIKINNLWDPHHENQIICEQRLKRLFGKPSVGRTEMLKLLEFHFLVKDDNNSSIPSGLVCSVASGTEVGGNMNDFPKQTNSRKRKGHKKSELKIAPNNLNEYAAIDVHNINLMYLRYNLMETLLKDQDSFSNKVIGSIVRIRISNDDQKQDAHRLVQIVGTVKATEPYKIGDRTADVMLEVLNLDKKEVVSIDAISNQEFTEAECTRLRQCIKCGFLKPLTVGEVQKKATELQPFRINDLIEAETLQLNSLQDRANESGNKKEHRECIDKLQLLNPMEGRQCRITEVPEIHIDLELNPSSKSEVDTKSGDSSRKDENVRPAFRRRGRKPADPNKKAVASGKEGRTTRAKSKMMENASHNSDKNVNRVSNNPLGSIRNDQCLQKSGSEALIATASTGNSPSAHHIETENLWHYRDPQGKIQGPFSMMHLREWSASGFFPPDTRIWTNHEQYDSVQLTDALKGHFHAALELSREPCLVSQENGTSAAGIRVNKVMNNVTTTEDSKQTEAVQCSNISSENNAGLVREDKLSSSSWPQCWDMLKDKNTRSDEIQAGDVPSTSSCVQAGNSLLVGCQEDNKFNCGEKTVSSDLTEIRVITGHETQNQCKNENRAGKSSEENLGSWNIDWSLNETESEAVLPPVFKSPDSSTQAMDINVLDLLSTAQNSGPVLSQLPDSSKHGGNIDVLDLLSPTLKTAANQQPISSGVQMQNADLLELLSLTPRSNNEDQAGDGTSTQQSGLLNFPLPSSGLSWCGASSVTADGMQLSNIGGEWCGYRYSPTLAKPSAPGWDSGYYVPSPSKPSQFMNENLAPALTSDGQQITTITSTSQSVSNTTSWLSMVNNEPIEFDSLGEDYVSDLLAEVDAMESQGKSSSPTSSARFAQELSEDCKDDCFSSIEDFSLTIDPCKSDAQSSTGEMHLTTSQSSAPCNKPIKTFDVFDSLRRSRMHSSASSEGETNAPVYDTTSEFHPNNTNQDMVNAAMTTSAGTDMVDPGWGTGAVQGNINLVTFQGNVNLVLGGTGQGMTNLNWGTSPRTNWVNPNMNSGPINPSLAWDNQHKYIGGGRFSSPWERGCNGGESGSGRGRQPRGRGSVGSSGRSAILKGQRCKFYENGHCKKGAFCDYLHP